jgi:hypothetical protein
MGAVNAVYTHDFVSSFDILKPDVWASLIRARGKQGGEFFSTITSLGFKVPTSNEDYSHFEDDWIHETAGVVGTVVYGAVNLGATFVLEVEAVTNRFYLREKDEVILKDGTVCYVTDIDVTAPTAPVVTIIPLVLGVTLSASNLLAADDLIINTNASDEGTGQPVGRFSGTRKYTNSLQIIKETLEVTGTQMTDGLWFNEVKIPGENGTKISAYMAKGQQDTEYRLALAMEGALLFGETNTNTANVLDPETGSSVQTTEGLIPYIGTNGNEINYTPGSWTISKFNEMNKVADKENAPSNYCGFLGIDLHTEIEDAFVDYLKDTNVSFTNDMLGGSKEKGVNIGFQYLYKTGRNYAFKRMHSFSNQKTCGSADYNYPQWGLFIPLGMNKTTDSNGTSSKLPTVGVRYKQLGKYNRFTEVWDVSGAGTGKKVTDLDKSNLYMRAHIGGHNQVGNQMFKVNP